MFLNPEIRLKPSPLNIKFLYWCTPDIHFWCTPDFDVHQRILYSYSDLKPQIQIWIQNCSTQNLNICMYDCGYASYTSIPINAYMCYHIKLIRLFYIKKIQFFFLFNLIFSWQIQIQIYLGWQERASINTNIFRLKKRANMNTNMFGLTKEGESEYE